MTIPEPVQHRQRGGLYQASKTGPQALQLRVAKTFLQRLRGQIGRPSLGPGQGLLLLCCASIHTCFIRGDLDVVYLDANFRICRLCEELASWRLSVGGPQAEHVLELAPGEIRRLGLRIGQNLAPALDPAQVGAASPRSTVSRSQRGSAMVEFAVVAPIILAIGLVSLQYALMFQARNEVTHASFMAARAGTVAHAELAAVKEAYARSLVPLYAKGQDEASLAQALVAATAEVAANTRIEILSPTRESFDDWNSAELEARYGRRAIRNDSLSARDPAAIGSLSGQNMQDANLLKLRLTHGYEMKVPIASTMVQYLLKWMDAGQDPFVSALYDRRRIPIVTHATMLMQTDPLEPNSPVSSPGQGNQGSPVDPGADPESSKPPPNCLTVSCASEGGPSSEGSGLVCEPQKQPAETVLSADVLFEFGLSSLTQQGKAQLDALISSIKGRDFDSLSLVGHTDPLGSATLNAALSLSRAQAVKSYMLAHGFPDKPITVEGRGSSQPVADPKQCLASADPIGCFSVDRRVVATFLGTK